MHSSRMHTARLLAVSPSMDCSRGSASVHAGIHPPEYGPGDPSGVGLETLPPGVGLETPLPRCGPGDHPWPNQSTCALGVGLEIPLETCKACWDTTCKACWDTSPPPCEQNHRHLQKHNLVPTCEL